MSAQFDIRPAQPADNAAMLALAGQSQPTNGVRFAFERTPDYFQSAQVSHQKPLMFVVERRSDKQVVGMVNIGFRDVFVDGQPRTIRYGSDLRVASELQGSRVLIYLNRIVREQVRDEWYQSIILEDNSQSRAALEGGRAGLPLFKPNGGIVTHTLTGRKRKGNALAERVRVAQVGDIPAMNRLVQDMAAYYQFLPAYNFWDLEAGAPYFSGLRINDFLVLTGDDGDIRGLVGLWNQKGFKQTRVIDYGRAVALFRPLYNAWSRVSGGFVLPARGQVCDYLALHSPLTHPEDAEGFRALMHRAWEATRERGSRAMTLTLADTDPRHAVIDDFRSIPMKATQYTVSFREEAQPALDSARIPFFESGRL